MNDETNKRQVPVTSRQTGETRLSEPLPVHTPHQSADAALAGEAQTKAPTELLGVLNDSKESLNADKLQIEGSSAESAKKSGSSGKPRAEIETLEQFIEYAYSRKGQRITLKPKVEKQIAQNPRLEGAALSRLLMLSKGDTQLAVPRQLLLLSGEIEGFPGLRAALTSFVSTLMMQHPVFAEAGMQGALLNQPEAISAEKVLAHLAQFKPKESEETEPLKGAELQSLRRNAANLFMTWLATSRGMSIDELAGLMFQVSWYPAARELGDDIARLRALSEVEQFAGVGLACLRFRQQAVEARAAQENALRELNDLRTRLMNAESQLQLSEEQCQLLQSELVDVRAKAESELQEVRSKHAEEKTHLHHGQEQLGGRMVRRLEDAVETLEVGLSALKNKTPRIEVMLERAELVVDVLRVEIKNLREE